MLAITEENKLVQISKESVDLKYSVSATDMEGVSIL